MNSQYIREQLNKLDHKALDECTKYYDLLNLYESLGQINSEDLKELEAAIRTKNPELISNTAALISAKRDPSKKSLLKKIQDTAIPSAKVESLDVDDLDKIYEEELNEDRDDLETVLKTTEYSNKIRYLPFDKKTGDYARFGTPYSYKTKKACDNAIKDHSKSLGYDKNNKPMFHNDDEEVVVRNGKEVGIRDKHTGKITEAANSQVFILRQDGTVIINPRASQEDLYDRISLDLKKLVKKSGEPFLGAVMLLRLYELTHGDPTSNFIPRKQWMIASGYSEKDSSHDGHMQGTIRPFIDDGLVERGGHNDFRLTEKGVAFVEGNNEEGQDLTRFSDKEFEKRKEARKNPKKSHTKKVDGGKEDEDIWAGIEYDDPTDVSSGSDSPSPESSDTPKSSTGGGKKKMKFDLDFVEALDNSQYLKNNIDECRQKEIQSTKDMYRYYAGLDESVEITEDMVDNYVLSGMCVHSGLDFDKARKDILS